MTVDYHSVYFEVNKLTDITSGAVIQKMKELFSRHGCHDVASRSGA